MTITESSDLFQHIIATVNRVTGAERGALFVYDKDTDPPQFRLKASKNITPEEIEHPDFCSSMDMISTVASAGLGLIRGPNSGSAENNSVKIYSRIGGPVIGSPVSVSDFRLNP